MFFVGGIIPNAYKFELEGEAAGWNVSLSDVTCDPLHFRKNAKYTYDIIASESTQFLHAKLKKLETTQTP